MPQIIASTYEIERKIGSGGGGIVYLGRHLRLDKKVVLKADKCRISTQPEALRREVDALKNLSHTYIPQVYDFIIEGETVYTVMDYIEGESFDKPLARGERFTQPQVIAWACQLLEALQYLHTRPPHGILHADIKPANIMLTPQNDIRLIDYNIALVLGAEGAVRVGFSRGYASPEHYGLDDTCRDTAQDASTVPMTAWMPRFTDGIEICSEPPPLSDAGSTSTKAAVLDVRSDIYSLGATLYHILTGNRPAQKAEEVAPIDSGQYSPAVIAIIEKAMDPDPDKRYQSAAEMLSALEHLHENDPRAKRYRRFFMLSAAVLSTVFLAGVCTAFVGLKQMEQLQSAYALAEYAQNALQSGDIPEALALSLRALPEKNGFFEPPYTAQAQKALTDALGVYDLSDGFKAHTTQKLPSEPFKIVLSPDGRTAAAVYAYAVAVFDTETAEIFAALPAEPSALSDAVFIENHVLLYAGEGALCAYDIPQKKILWTGDAATSIAVSADRKTAATVYKNEPAAKVYDVDSGRVVGTVPFEGKQLRVAANDAFADPEDSLFALNRDGTLLAVSFEDGSLDVFDLENNENTLEIYNTSAFTHFEGGFFAQYFAFSAANSAESVFAVLDMQHMEQTGGFSSARPFRVQASETGIYVAADNLVVKLDPVSGAQAEAAYTQNDIMRFVCDGIHTAAATDAGELVFFDADANELQAYKNAACDFVQVAGDYAVAGSRDTPVLRVQKLDSHPEAQLMKYDPSYMHDEARLSADGGTVMLFRYDSFRICDRTGAVRCETAIPDAEQVYDQQYRRDESGSWLEVLYNDGTVRTYSAKDGRLLSQTTGEKPDLSLDEIFYTDTFQMTAPLHGTPAAYDRKTGELVRELEKDAYLAYVTQTGSYVITEYVTADGERYGLLLNEKCETLARLPNLCDIVGDMLIFDDRLGNLRKSRIYSIEELIALAKNKGGR